jgi:hypothetical protein
MRNQLTKKEKDQVTDLLIKYECHNPSLGLATKAKACEGVGQKRARESHFMLPRMQENVREWTPTLPNELPSHFGS